MNLEGIRCNVLAVRLPGNQSVRGLEEEELEEEREIERPPPATPAKPLNLLRSARARDYANLDRALTECLQRNTEENTVRSKSLLVPARRGGMWKYSSIGIHAR